MVTLPLRQKRPENKCRPRTAIRTNRSAVCHGPRSASGRIRGCPRSRCGLLHCGLRAPVGPCLLELDADGHCLPASSMRGRNCTHADRLRCHLQREKQDSFQDFLFVLPDFSSVAPSLRRRHQAQTPHDYRSPALPPLRPRMERTLRRSFDLLAAKVKDFGCVSFRLAAQFVRIVR